MSCQRLGVVTNYPPDRRPLSEYARYLVKGLRCARPEAEVMVCAGRVPNLTAEAGVVRCWRYGHPGLIGDIVRTAEELKLDAAIVNAHFAAFGTNLANFAALSLASILRKRGMRSLVYLHHLPHNIETEKLCRKVKPWEWWGIELACRAVAGADCVVFTLEGDAEVFSQRYGGNHVTDLPLMLTGPPSPFRPPPITDKPVVLTIGRWGNAKHPEKVINAFLAEPLLDDACLVLAGSDHSASPGTLDETRTRYAHAMERGRVRIVGYVEDRFLPDLFAQSALVILDYQATTGWSAAMQLAAQYGRVVVCNDLAGFRHQVATMGIHALFAPTSAAVARIAGQVLRAGRGRLVAQGTDNYRNAARYAPDRLGAELWRLVDGDTT